MAWLPLTSTTVEPARLDMERWASGGIILSSVAIRYQLGLALHAGSLILALRAATPHGTWESAMNAAFSVSTSAPKEAGDFALSRNKKPSCGGSIGGTGAPGGGAFIKVGPDPPLSRGNAVIHEPCNLWIVSGFSDHRPSIGVADENCRSVLRCKNSLGNRNVVVQRYRRVLDDADIVAVPLQNLVDALPASAVHKATVD